jgi:hypothetical protein
MGKLEFDETFKSSNIILFITCIELIDRNGENGNGFTSFNYQEPLRFSITKLEIIFTYTALSPLF